MCESTQYNLYCLYSSESLHDIHKAVEEAGYEVIMMRIDYNRKQGKSPKEKSNVYVSTDRTLVVIKGENINLKYKFKIYDTDNVVVGTDPSILTLNVDDETLEDIRCKMLHFVSYGIIDERDYSTDLYHDCLTISFSKNVDNRLRAIIKTMLDQPPNYRVSWLRSNFRDTHKQKNNKNVKSSEKR